MSEVVIGPKEIVEIAKDVILQLNGKSIIAQMGKYFTDGYIKLAPRQAVELRDFLRDNKPKCTVCARGALVVSKAKLFDDCKFVADEYGEFSLNQLTEDHSRDIFGELGYNLECAFEGWDSSVGRNRVQNGFHTEFSAWKLVYPDAESRLRALMQNLIRNDGKFIHTQYIGTEWVPPLPKAKKKKAKLAKSKAKGKVVKPKAKAKKVIKKAVKK